MKKFQYNEIRLGTNHIGDELYSTDSIYQACRSYRNAKALRIPCTVTMYHWNPVSKCRSQVVLFKS